MKFEGGTWSLLDNSFSSGDVSLVLDSNGVPYVLLTDGTVRKYDGSLVTVGGEAFI